MVKAVPFKKPVYITNPFLPNLQDIQNLLEEIWDSGQVTNNGQIKMRYEKALASFLKAEHLSVFSNGTSALQIALRVLNITGEVITTPFTFAATPHALALNNIKPIFCDIEEDTMNINPERIESLINPNTTAILPVHVFGVPCDVQRIDRIAKKHNLNVIYDAAHAFGVELEGNPVGCQGDISMFSLHATKVCHSIEGGILVYKNGALKERADLAANFGLTIDGDVEEVGLNAKMNELQAAVGLSVLKGVEEEIQKRKALTVLYREHLGQIPGIKTAAEMEGVTYNYPYLVIRVDQNTYGISRDDLFTELQKYNVFCRKYFYPLCSSFTCYREGKFGSLNDRLPIAEQVAGQVLSLPLHGRLFKEDVENICAIIWKLKK